MTDDREQQGRQFREVERLIAKVAEDFAARYGLDVDELLSEGGLAFLKAVRTYDWAGGGRGFAGWVYYLMVLRCCDVRRKAARRRPHAPLHDAIPCRRGGFDAGRFAADLSGDAVDAINAVLAPPPDVVIDALTRSPGGTRSVPALRASVRAYLRACVGPRRAKAAFAEVREALSEGG